MRPDFEEKVYKSYFNVELAKKAKFYPIGQVEEGILGFDSSFYVSKSRIFYWQNQSFFQYLQWKDYLNTRPLFLYILLID